MNMDPISFHQLAAACGGKLVVGDGAKTFRSVVKDSRSLQPGELYWALRGENFDGHDFVAAAAVAGAAGAVVETVPPGSPGAFPLVVVPDSLAALQRLASWHRDRIKARVICITGSNGKTSTKDFTASVVATRFMVTKTAGNLNNHIGLPLTILAADSDHEVAVWEIGMNHPGEIAALARMARPDIGIITNIGVAHIEFLGSRKGIAQEKGMMGEALTEHDLLVLPSHDEFTPSLAARTKARIRLAGDGAQLHAEDVRAACDGLDFELVSGDEKVATHLPVTGEHMVRNALLAVAAGVELGLSLRECASGLAATQLSKGRLACLKVRGVTILDDSYNANPDSMDAALHALRGLPGGGRRIAVLGRMGELGSYAEEGYRRVGRTAAGAADFVIVVGEEASPLADEAEAAGARAVQRVSDTHEAASALRELAVSGDTVLIKGSRSARMERVLEDFS